MSGKVAAEAGTVTVAGRVLLVEPDQAERHRLRRILQAAGAVVDTATTHRQALVRFDHQRYTVVVSTTSLGGASVFDLIDRVDQLGQGSWFVLMTDGPYFERQDRAGLDAIVGALSRPVVENDLLALVERGAALSKPRRPSSKPPASRHPVGMVLVVDHHLGDVERLQGLLRGLGYSAESIVVVDRMQRALALVDQRRFALAIAELTLPDASGMDVVHRLSAADATLPIVVLSGAPIEVCEQALACGAQEVTHKGRMLEELPAAIKRAMLRKASDETIRYRATMDSMTGLFNRAHFVELLERAVARTRRGSTGCAVVYLDLDGFKPINDRYGHSAGDHALKTVAKRLRQSLRECDVAARLGGDEFALLIDDVSDRDHMVPVAQRVLRCLSEPISFPDDKQACVSGSLGIAMWPKSGSALELLDAADAAMYMAKDAGGNQYFFAVEAAARKDNGTAGGLAAELEAAVADGDFYLLFQPQVDLQARRISGFEALLRWRRRNAPRLGPDRFVPILEQTGMIVDVGTWVLREAIESVKQWAQTMGRSVRVSINVSVRQIEQPGFATHVEQLLKEAGVPPQQLNLELTETALLRDTGGIQRALEELHETGVRIVLDDFGAGYASLRHLQCYPLDGLKIDRSLIQPLTHEGRGRVLVGAVIELAHQLQLEVIAEGVEKNAQLRYLHKRGCDTCQGFLFGRPQLLGDSRASTVWNAYTNRRNSGYAPVTARFSQFPPPASSASWPVSPTPTPTLQSDSSIEPAGEGMRSVGARKRLG